MYSLLKSSMINTLSGGVSLAAGFGSTILIARLLGAEGTGLTAFALWLVFSGYAVADRGIPAVIMRYLARSGPAPSPAGNLTRQLYGRFIWPVLLGTAAFGVYALFPVPTASDAPPVFWILTAGIFFIYCHAQLASSAAFANGDYLSPARRAAVGCLLQLPAVAAGAYFFGAAGAMAGYLVRHLPQALAAPRLLTAQPSGSPLVSEKMLKYGRSSWLSSALVVLVRTRVEFIFIGWFFSLTEVGYFAAGIAFTSLVMQLAMSMTAGMTPKFGHLKDTGEANHLQLVYQRVLRWMAFLLLPVSLGGAAIMQEVVPLVLGADFQAAVPTATVLMLLVFPSGLVLVPIMIMQANEKPHQILLLNAISAAVLITLNLVLTPHFGSIGAAWIKGALALSGLAAVLWFCQVKLGYACGLEGLLKLGLSSGLSAISAWWVLSLLAGIPGLVLAILLAALVYPSAIRLTGAMPKDDLEPLRKSLAAALPAPLARPALYVVSFVGKS